MNVDRLVKRTAIVVFLLCVAGVVLAGVVSTEAPPVYEVHLDDNTMQKGAWPATEAECVARAKALLPSGCCVVRRKFTNVGTCDDVPKPALPRELDAEGYVIKPPVRAKQLSDTDWLTEIQDYVPAPYPTCWVIGWREITEADVNDEASDLLADEPVEWPAELLAAYAARCAERHEHKVYYEGDQC